MSLLVSITAVVTALSTAFMALFELLGFLARRTARRLVVDPHPSRREPGLATINVKVRNNDHVFCNIVAIEILEPRGAVFRRDATESARIALDRLYAPGAGDEFTLSLALPPSFAGGRLVFAATTVRRTGRRLSTRKARVTRELPNVTS